MGVMQNKMLCGIEWPQMMLGVKTSMELVWLGQKKSAWAKY
jgi:hypothetical protein